MGKHTFAAGVLLALFFSTAAWGQSTYASVSGTIEDASRALLPGVSVTVTNSATGVVTTTVSNESGVYNGRFDANMSKSIKISESKTLQFRVDATDVLNHPEPATPVLDVNSANFGLITGAAAKSTLHR